MTFKLSNCFNFTKNGCFQKNYLISCPIHHYIDSCICTHLTHLAKIHGRFGWNAKPLTRGDLVSNFVSIFEAYLASLHFKNFQDSSEVRVKSLFQPFLEKIREWRVVQTRPTELPLLKHQKSSIIFFLKVNLKITRYFYLTYKLRKKCNATQM